MEKIDKLLKRYLKRKVKMTTAVLVAFLISGSLSFASGSGSGIGDVLDDQRHDLYLAPGEYTPDDDGNINMSLINRQDGNGEDMPDESIYNMSEEDFNKLSDHDKELLKNRRVIIKNVVNKDKMIGDVTSNTLTITNGTDRLYGADDLTVELKDDSVDTNHLKDNAVTGEKIQDGAVTEGKLGTDSVTEEKIKDGAVTTEKISDGNVTESKLGTDSVTEEKIKDGAVTENKLANDAVTEGKIKDGAVTTDKLGANAVTSEKINDGAVTTDKLGANAVTSEKINDGAVTTDKLGANAVTSEKINDGAVTTDKLGANAVTSEKINDGAVSKEKLSEPLKTEIDGKVNKADLTGDITSTTITVTGGDNKLLGDVKLEVADGAITTAKLADNAVTEAKINNGAVSKEKLSAALKTKIAEIDNKANIDATNIDTDKYISKLNEGVNIDTPAGKLVKDSDLKKHLDENYYNKSQIDTMVNRTDSALSGVANAVAMANLPQVSSYNDYRHMVSAAYGNYEGQSAISVGLSGISQNNRVTYKVSGSLNTKGKLALGAGIGVMIGKVKTPTIEMPTSIKDKLEKSEKERQEMQVKLSEQKEMVNKQAEQIKDLYEIIKGLKEELKKR